jgi:hypothetical protein
MHTHTVVLTVHNSPTVDSSMDEQTGKMWGIHTIEDYTPK